MGKNKENEFLLNDKISFVERNIRLAICDRQQDSFYRRVLEEITDAISFASDHNYQVQVGYLCALKEVLLMCDERDVAEIQEIRKKILIK